MGAPRLARIDSLAARLVVELGQNVASKFEDTTPSMLLPWQS
jgi:hypothetical protein